MKKLKERKRKQDIRLKLANLIARIAYQRKYAIILEKFEKHVASNMIKKIKDKKLRHRIYQSAFKGVQKAIEEKAKEYGVPVIYVNPKNTSKICPIHNSPINYGNSSRIGKCSKGGELWHRDVAACWNILLKALWGDGSIALSPTKQNATKRIVDGRSFPFSATATHDPTRIPKSVWARWNSLGRPQIAE